jgi:hypothetical protein
MKPTITFRAFEKYVAMLGSLRRLGLMVHCDFMVTWERKPKMVLSRYGEIEFENPQDVYGATITLWADNGMVPLARKKFMIVGQG